MEMRRFRDSIYWIGADGSVWNSKRGGYLSPANTNGYKMVNLSLGERGSKKKVAFLVHRLVGECWLESIEGKGEINHKNGNKGDNRVENLEWCSRRENMNHAIAMGLIEINPANWVRGLKKRKVSKRKLDIDPDILRMRVIGGDSYEDLALEFGVSSGLIYSMSNGKNGYVINGPTLSDIKKEKNRLRRDEIKRSIEERKAIRANRNKNRGKGEVIKVDWGNFFGEQDNQ